MNLRRHLYVLVFLLLSVQIVWAQVVDCPEFVQVALDRLGDNCGDMARNNACYGYDLIYSTFTEPVEPDFFNTPSDRAPLATLNTISTTPLNPEQETWGVAVMKVQANVPRVLPGEAVTFVLLGEANLENRVPVDAMAAEAAEPLELTTSMEALVQAIPAWNTNSLGSLAAGTLINTDAVTEDGGWLRINYEDQIGWIRSDEVNEADAVSSLPAITSPLQSPMQAFYFTTGIGQPACNQAPDVISVRSPENITVDLSVNGLNVRLGSLITLKSGQDNEVLFTVHEGSLQVPEERVRVNPGETLVTLVDDENTIIELSEVRDATFEEYEHGRAAVEALREVLPEDTVFDFTPGEGNEIIHIVQRGETLYSIARLYDASAPAIVERNNIVDPNNLLVGTALVIPNPGSGFVPLTVIPQPLDTTLPDPVIVPDALLDCTNFRGTSPLDGLAYGRNTFYWNQVPGATNYRVNVRNVESRQGASFTVPGTENSLVAVIDINTVGGGFNFEWWVEALFNGQVACNSGPFAVLREAVSPEGLPPDVPPPDAPPPGVPDTPVPVATDTPVPGATDTPIPIATNTNTPIPTDTPVPVVLVVSWACSTGGGAATITYSGLPTGQTVTFAYEEQDFNSLLTPQTSGPHPAPSGTVSVPFPTFIQNLQNGVAVTSAGLTQPITPAVLSGC